MLFSPCLRSFLCIAALFTDAVLPRLHGNPAAARSVIAEAGALGDGETINTGAIQAVIDRLARAGGGTVVVPRGVFVSGALFFKPGVHLHLDPGAVLQCSTNLKNFPVQRTRIEGHFEEAFNPALINAADCDGFRITGEGTLDGNGRPVWDEFWAKRNAAPDRKNFKNLSVPRARLALIENSKDVVVEGVTFKNSQFWNLHLYRCRNVRVGGVRFEVPDDYGQAPSSDGIDVDSCQDVEIRKCTFSVTDDCIALKGSKGPDALNDKDSPPVERIRISDCVFRRGHSMLTCGSEATVVRDVVLENCEVKGPVPLLTLKLRPDTPQVYENITVRNVMIDAGAKARIVSIDRWTQFFDLKGQPEPRSVVDKITLSGIRGRVGSLGVIRGNAQTQFGDISLENIDVQTRTETLDTDRRVKLHLEHVVVNGKPFSVAGQ